MVGRILHLRSKGIALGVTLVALLAVVGACAGGGDAGVTAAPAAPAAPAAATQPSGGETMAQPEPAAPAMKEPKYGGVFNLAIRGNPKTLQLYKDGATPARQTVEPAFDGLLTYNADGDYRDEFILEPSLAESWELENESSYLFHLRKGVKFHDGSEMTSADVVWSLEYLTNPENKFRAASNIAEAESFEAVDAYTVRITTKGPSPSFLHNTPNGNVIIASKNLATGGEDISKQLLGTGPFRIVSWDGKSGAEYVRNDDHWREGQPYWTASSSSTTSIRLLPSLPSPPRRMTWSRPGARLSRRHSVQLIPTCERKPTRRTTPTTCVFAPTGHPSTIRGCGRRYT